MEGAALYALGALCGLLALMRVFASQVYDVLVVRMTSKWYKAVLARLPEGAVVLDVGIGTGTALLRNAASVEGKRLRVVGVDYDAGYVRSCAAAAERAGLRGSVEVHCKSIFDADLGAVVRKGLAKDALFDAAYFSGSWTLMPTPAEALRVAAALVKPEGKVYVTQTFQRAYSPVMGVVKPLLKYLTTIDFGNLHYTTDLERYVREAAQPKGGWALRLEEDSTVPGSIDNSMQVAKLLVFKRVKA